MRRKISLYIADKLVDLDDQNLILFNYTQDEASNPTIVKNSYTQEVSIPGTARNNEIFGKIFRLDRITSYDSFNSLKKTPFKIYNELNEILEAGYCKLNRIDKTKSFVTYSVSLYGGLGDFFYSLMYNEDGTKKTLADMYFVNPVDPEQPISPKFHTMSLMRSAVLSAWNTLSTGSLHPFYSVFNFAPCYNGFPACKFDANRAVYKPQGTNNMPNLYVEGTDEDGLDYATKEGANGHILLEMENKHTEWEVQDLRAYLQRPVISLKYLFESFAMPENQGEYKLILDRTFFVDSNWFYEAGWMTLQMFDRDNLDPASFLLSDLLKGTASPAEYLISMAKVMGLYFVVDSAAKTITLCCRNAYYVQDVSKFIDLRRRIDPKYGILPSCLESKHYIWEYPKVFGQFASEYAAKYGKTYGSQWVNTGYDFNADQVKVLDGIVLNGAAEVIESNANYRVYGGNADQMGVYSNYLLKFALTEKVSWKLYNSDGDDERAHDFEPYNPVISPFNYSGIGTDFRDFMPKAQLHQDDDKAEDGSNVLLFFNGMKQTPSFSAGSVVIASVDFHLSDDDPSMSVLNSGVPCWDVSLIGNNITNVERIPEFGRWYKPAGVFGNMEFGNPQEIATDIVPLENVTLYSDFWKRYIEDKFDKDCKVVTCKVDFSGYKVDAHLMQNFYYFDNCIWVLNKIMNHSLTTYDLTECEFIKVKNVDNVNYGQIEF